MQLIIVRHGETEWTRTGQYTGVTELDLTENGIAQAQNLQAPLTRLVGDGIARVYSSPRRRASETARLALPNVTIVDEPLLVEFGYGEYEGLTPQQIYDRNPNWDIWRDGCPGGETAEAVAGRARAFLSKHLVQGADAVIAVTHGHFSRILACVAVGRSTAEGAMFASSTASVSVVRKHRGQWLLWLWNYTALLDEA